MVLHYKLKYYVITASLIGMAGSGICLISAHQGNLPAQLRVLRKPYCTEAMKILERNQVAMDLIGRPIRICKPDVTDKSFCKFETLLTDITVPFEGAQKSGNLHIEADRPTAESEWSVRKLDIRFSNIPNKLLIVYKRKEIPNGTANDSKVVTDAIDSKHEWL